MQQHVQLADRPGRSVIHLATKPEIGRIAAGLFDVFAADDEHAARAAGGIVDAHAGPGMKQAHHEADDVARGVEVAALLAGRLGEHVDEEFVGRAEQVGKLEVLVAQGVPTEVPNQVLAGVVGDNPLVALDAHELDVVQDMLQGLIVFSESAESLVQDAAVGFGCVAEPALQVVPAGALGDEEGVVIVRVLPIARHGHFRRNTFSHLSRDQRIMFGFPYVGAALKEEHAEDVVLVRGRVQTFLAQTVGGGV